MDQRRALLMERREDLRRDLTALMSGTFRVDIASGVDEGIDLLRRGTYELVVWGIDGSEPDRIGQTGQGREPCLALWDLLLHGPRFGGRLVLLADRDLNDSLSSTKSSVTGVQVKVARLPLSIQVLTRDWPRAEAAATKNDSPSADHA